MKYRIAIKVGDQVKDIFNIQYTSDGGFFFQDKIRINSNNKKCLILKAKSDCNHHGLRSVRPDYRAVTSGDVKFAHHFDGRSHISGKGVLSGYDKDGNPKGASLYAFKLSESNDTGAFFSMLFYGWEFFRDTTKSSIILTPDERNIHTVDQGREDLNGIFVKALYFLKEWLTPEQLSRKTLLCQSRIEGEVEVTLLPSPAKSPGLIGLFAAKAHHGFTAPFGFSMSGAPGKIDDKGFCDNLVIIYPHDGASEGDVPDLNFK